MCFSDDGFSDKLLERFRSVGKPRHVFYMIVFQVLWYRTSASLELPCMCFSDDCFSDKLLQRFRSVGNPRRVFFQTVVFQVLWYRTSASLELPCMCFSEDCFSDKCYRYSDMLASQHLYDCFSGALIPHVSFVGTSTYVFFR